MRNYLVPFHHDETATFFFYIQSGEYMPFHSHVDANNHVLNSCLSNICFNLFGSSPFSLRIPNFLAFLVLAFGTYKIANNLKSFGTKLILTACFLCSFHWITFFSTCRGYGISMAFLVLGIAYLIDFIKSEASDLRKLFFTLMAFQVSVSANLILIIVTLMLSAFVLINQLMRGKLFGIKSIVIWMLYLGLMMYWLKFSFYLQESGALYYGEGDSYWKVTFVSLINVLVGQYNPLLKWLMVVIGIATIGACAFTNKQQFKNVFAFIKQPSLSLLFLVFLITLVIGFYAMHKVLGVNFPEDRTGLFFYVFFCLMLVFTIDELPDKITGIISSLIALTLVIHFCVNLNFRKHSLNVYETIPEHFFTTLLNEQKQSTERITIGGHRVRELFFGFMNYRNGFPLNPADPTEVMQMNCDYYIATKVEEKYYKPYYDVIDTEPDWGFVILKRKEKIKRTLVAERNNVTIDTPDNEYNEIYHVNDTVIANQKPIIAEVNFDINKLEFPAHAWFVMQINDSLDQTIDFKRYPLQWMADDINGKTNMKLSLISGNLPAKSKKIVCFFWNINKQPMAIKVNTLKLYQIDGNGVNYVAPDIK